MTCLATFNTTSMALMFERACRKAGVSSKIIPVPRRLSSSCGLACDFPCDSRTAVEEIVKSNKLEISGIHELQE